MFVRNCGKQSLASPCPSVCRAQFDIHQPDMHENLYWPSLKKFLLKSDKNNECYIKMYIQLYNKSLLISEAWARKIGL
jgi:hypothetical protein